MDSNVKIVFFSLLVLVMVSGCGDSASAPVADTDDALAQQACTEAEHAGETVHSVLNPDEAIEHALIHAGEPVTVDLAGPTSYLALEVPNHHSDYGVFTRPAAVLKATSTTTLPEEAHNGACTDEGLGDNRIHIHEFDYSILTLEGSGTVWLYFAQDGESGHGDHDAGADDHA